MNFSEWKLLEYLSSQTMNDESNKVKKIVNNNFKHLYTVPNFDIFERPNEPEQQSNLFTDSDLNTFSINYTTTGKLYSIDIWKNNETSPYITYYIQSGDIEDVAYYIPQLINLKIKRVELSKPRILQESTISIIPETPKKETSIDKLVANSDKKLSQFSDPETVWEDLHKYMEMIISRTQPSLIVMGPPGASKTFPVLKQLNDAGLKKNVDYFRITGKSTDAAMYTSLYEHNGKIIIYDDCDSVLKHEDGLNILKGALDTYEEREISWQSAAHLKTSDGRVVPKTFVFTGNIVFITNKQDLDEAILSRSFFVKIHLSPEDMIKKMRKELPNINPHVPLSIREDAMDFIEKIAKKTTKLDINMRTLIKAIKILRNVDDLTIAERLILQQCSIKK